MAVIVPSGWREMQATGAAQRELETVAFLADALPDAYTVYHGVHWTRVESGFSAYGEIDFAVVAPSGKCLLIEQKSGFLTESPDGLLKAYAGKTKSIPSQITRSVDALRRKFDRANRGRSIRLDYLLYAPDFTVMRPDIAGISPERIVDAKRREHLARIIQSIAPDSEPASPDAEFVHRFLRDELELVPEIGAISDEARALYTRVSGGLATWGRRIACDPFRLRVAGTAGSGKTQLALRALQDAAGAGRRALYVCFNRPLADHMTQIVPREAMVATYHQLCDRFLQSKGIRPDFTRANVFRGIEDAFAAGEIDEAWRFDELIVDEGQDFEQRWVEPLLRLLRPGGRAWWMEDPMQNLYDRLPVALEGWTTLRSDTNYRSPQDVLKELNQLVDLERPIEAGSPITGSGVGIHTYPDTASLLDETRRAIGDAIKAGFKRPMIAVVTFRGRGRSALTPYDRLGQYSLRTFTGKYDLLGLPIYSDGDITLETVYRFKGQSAPAIVLTEIDFEALDQIAVRKLFVGATRATMKLYLVMSERVAKGWMERLSD